MVFDRLADFITKHAKMVVLIWLLVLVASAYPAMHASEHLSYDTNSMGSADTESIKGMEIIGAHFQSQISSETMQMIIVETNPSSPLDEARTSALISAICAISERSDLIESVVQASQSPEMMLFAATYNPSLSSSEIADDTCNLRIYVSDAVEDVLGDDSGSVRTFVTGTPAISYDSSKSMTSDMMKIDPFSILLILVLVGLFFRSIVSSATPPMVIGVAFALVLCALFFLGQVLDIFYITEVLLLVSMLGAGCDYCIFILSRYREERRRGLEHIPACREAITWAGESVATSGIAVMIGFGAMMVCSFRLVSYMGLGLAIGIVFAIFAALTLMSSLLVIFGDRMFWPTGASGEKLDRGYLRRMGHVAEVYFTKSTRFSIKHAKAIILATVLFTVPMVYVYATSESSYDMIGSMMSGESQEGMIALTSGGEGGSVMPNYAVFELSEPLGTVTYLGQGDQRLGMLSWTADTAYREAVLGDCSTLVANTMDMDNVASAYFDYISGNLSVGWEDICVLIPASVLPDTGINSALEFLKASGIVPATAVSMLDLIESMFTTETIAALHAAGISTEYDSPDMAAIMDWALFVETGALGITVGADGIFATVDYISMTMATEQQALSDESVATVSHFKSDVHAYVDGSSIFSQVWVSGTAAVMVEISDVMNSEFLKIELTAIILIILLLFFVMRSYFTPIRSVATIFMSVIWTVAITHLLFDGLMHDGVLWILPIILLVICLGLGMDYDILLTTRIREYRMSKGMDNDTAITQAVLHSGSVITVCGLIMGGTFGTLMFSSTVMLQQMGFALCFAILVDALIVRTYIVPAAMHLMGEWNWKGPRFLHRSSYSARTDEGSDGSS